MEQETTVDPLCCCEYFNSNNERSHVLMCCCNCVELDQAFDRIICCNSVPSSIMNNLLSNIQDRLRVPWLHGARRIPFEAIFPAVILFLSAIVSSISLKFLVIAVLILPVIVLYSLKCFMRYNIRTRFLLFFVIYSCTVLFIIYQSIVIKFCEISATENFIFIFMSASAILCFYNVRHKAQKSQINKTYTKCSANVNSDDLIQKPLLEENDNCEVDLHNDGCVSESCICNISKHADHCRICQRCILDKKYHSIWLNCCINKDNQMFYNLGMVLSAASLLYGSSLILTTVCHPFEFVFGILLPDDCEDVYYDNMLKICFIAGVYSFELGLGALILLFYHVCC